MRELLLEDAEFEPVRVFARVAGLVELVDLLPSIAELAGVVLPADETFDGVSFVVNFRKNVIGIIPLKH